MNINTDDYERVKTLIAECGGPYQTRKKINRVMEDLGISYRMDKMTPYRIYKGEAAPSMIAFTITILDQY